LKRSEWIYLAIIGGAVFLVVLLTATQERPPDWRDSFSRHDRIAFGSRILFEVLPDVFPGASIRSTERPPYLWLEPGEDFAAIFITGTFAPQAWDAEDLLDFVHAGGRAFIAAHTFAGPFADSIGVSTSLQRPHFGLLTRAGGADSVGVLLTDFPGDDPVVFSRGLGGAFFETHDPDAAVLGRNDQGNPNLLMLDFGDGFFVLSTVPVAFTNYALVDEATASYAFAALSYLPVSDIVWDESHKPMAGANTPLRYVLSERSLAAAYWVLAATLLLGLVMGVRRRQRVIPVITRPRNDTADFVRTVGTLYLQRRDHRGLAEKKIAHLMAFIRTELRVSDPSAHPGTVATRAGLDVNTVTSLFARIETLQRQSRISSRELIDLSRAVDQFYAAFRVPAAPPSESQSSQP
jgi:hypothetical protein